MYLWGLNERAMIITKTPFRMSFFGGGTDIPSFFKEHGGAVISTTFDKYCYVNVRHLPPFMPSECDYLIGPSSTFSLVAVMYRVAPLYCMDNADENKMTAEAFRRFDYWFKNMV